MNANAVVDTSNNGNLGGGETLELEVDASGPSVPTLSTPADSGRVNTLKPTLTWTASSDV